MKDSTLFPELLGSPDHEPELVLTQFGDGSEDRKSAGDSAVVFDSVMAIALRGGGDNVELSVGPGVTEGVPVVGVGVDSGGAL